MQWQFEYTGYIWPMLASAIFMWALTAYSWRHRGSPGAVPLASGVFVVGLWALTSALETVSADLPTKLFWFRVKNVVNNPAPVFGFCFALEYSGLGGWVTRRNLALLLLPSVASVPMMLLDDSRLLWTGYWLQGSIHRTLAPMGVAMNLYAVVLLFLATAVIALLLVRSPLHRTPAALIMLGNLGIVAVLPLEVLNIIGGAPFDVSVLGTDFTFAMYAIALYRFRIFDVVPVARETVLERMVDGMLVLDARSRLMDLNPAAVRLLGIPRAKALGRQTADILAVHPGLSEICLAATEREAEFLLRADGERRCYGVRASSLIDRRGFRLGRLIIFRDITETKRAREMLVEQQRALATLQERDRVARELHDGLGQVLGFVKMQAQAAQELVARDPRTAESYLAQLASVAQDAHADIREYILGARTTDDADSGFLAPLRQYLERFSSSYGLSVELAAPPELGEDAFGPAVQVQLLRIIQESLTNSRKHAHASHVQVKFTLDGSQMDVTITDDGQGFDPAHLVRDVQKYGLRFMRERAEEVGGTLEVQSAPGQSTRVVVRVPRQDVPSVNASNFGAASATRE
jgi:PAS domain S-box-containing protein